MATSLFYSTHASHFNVGAECGTERKFGATGFDPRGAAAAEVWFE